MTSPEAAAPAADLGLLASIFDASPALVYVKDRENRFLFANLSLCRLFGRERSELVGGTTHDFLPAAIADQHRANDERVLREGASLQIEETNEEPDGTHTYLTLKYPLRSAAGEVVAVCGISTDITPQRRREEAAVAGEETLKSLLNAITESAFLMDKDGTVLAVNETAALRLGGSVEDLVGSDIYTRLPPEVADRRREWVRRTVQSGEPQRFEDVRAGRDIINSVYPVHKDGRVERLAVFGADVTGLRETERRLAASEQYFRLIAENATDVVFRATNEGVCEWMSPSVSALVGWRPEDFVGRRFADFVHPDDVATLRAGQTAVLSGAPTRYELRVRTRDGDYRWMSISLRPILADDGTVVGRAGGWRDIQARVEAREALAASEARYRTLAESSPDYIFIIDRDLSVSYLNSAAAVALGCETGELPVPLTRLFSPETAAGMEAGLRALFATGEPKHSEACWPGPWGRRWLATWLVPVIDEAGAVVQVFGVSRDVSELKGAQQALAALNAELEERVHARTAQLRAANEELKAFAYSVSHDLRAPLRAIDGFSQVVLEDEAAALSDAGRENLGRVSAAARRMAELIDAMLVLSRLSRRPLDLGPVDLSALAESIAARLRDQDGSRRVRFVVAQECVVRADAQLMEVVLTNLLANAWKFTSGTAFATIEFGQTNAGGERAFFVRDDGAGFDPAYSHKLFQPFQRLHSEAEFAGTGIGLATVRRIVSRLGGRCWAEGEVGEGATFSFTVGEPLEETGGAGADDRGVLL